MTTLLARLFGIVPEAADRAEAVSFRFTGMPGGIWTVMAVAGVAGLLAWATVHNYRREGHSPRALKIALAAVRLAVLLLLLGVFLRPALVFTYRRTLRHAVLVLLDDSRSMRWRDRYLDPVERATLARNLGLDPAAFTATNRPARGDIVRRVLAREQDGLAALAADHPLLLYRFGAPGDAHAEYVEPLATWTAPPAPGAVETALARLSARGPITDLGRAVRDALARLEGRRIGAVVVVSDGQATGRAARERGLGATVRMTAERGLPVYTVGVGDPTPLRNVRVTQLQGPGDVRRGSQAAFTVFLGHRDLAGREVTVELFRCRAGEDRWETTGTARTVALAETPAEGTALQEVSMAAEADEVGTFLYRAEVAPLPEEQIRDDNDATTALRVSDEKIAVLLVSGDAGWEYRYLRNYLLRQPEHYRVTTWQQNADPRFNQDASTGMKRTTLPATRDEMFAYDVILLYDPRPGGGMDERFLGQLDDFVAEHHGGLCYLAGNKYSGETLVPGGAFAALSALLPVVIDVSAARSSPVLSRPDRAWPVQPTPAGESHPVMQLADRVEDSLKTWQSFPGVYGSFPVARLKTLATPLAVTGDESAVMRDGQRRAMLAVQYYGKGRVLYFGFDSTWRWRFVDDAAVYDRFWGNVIDYLAAGRLQKKRILITTDGSRFEVGARMAVRVEAYDREFAPLEQAALTVTLRPEGGGGEASDHVLSAARPGVFEGRIPAERTGHYRLTAVAPEDATSPWVADDVAERFVEVRPPQEELRRPEADFDALRELAVDRERFVRIYETGALAERIPPGEVTRTWEEPHEIWNRMAVLVLIGLFLLAEWVGRKWFNLA